MDSWIGCVLETRRGCYVVSKRVDLRISGPYCIVPAVRVPWRVEHSTNQLKRGALWSTVLKRTNLALADGNALYTDRPGVCLGIFNDWITWVQGALKSQSTWVMETHLGLNDTSYRMNIKTPVGRFSFQHRNRL